jgi:uncharacterized protein YeaO (DUF488 family)
LKRSNYLEEVAHGEIYTAPLDKAKEVKRIGNDHYFVLPLKGEAWQRLIPPRGRLVKIDDFDVRPELAPSRRLLSGFKRNLMDTHDFNLTYSLEMEEEKCQDSIRELALLSLESVKLVVFGLSPPNATCHRQMLAKLIARAVVENSTSRHRAKIKAYLGELSL